LTTSITSAGPAIKGPAVCTETKHMSATELEARVWEAVFDILKDPDQLRADLEAMIELERAGVGGDPDKETKLWAKTWSNVTESGPSIRKCSPRMPCP
jgi:hypothetical protein